MTCIENCDSDLEAIDNFVESGYLALTVHDFNAYIELETDIQPTLTLYSWTAPFPSIPLYEFGVYCPRTDLEPS